MKSSIWLGVFAALAVACGSEANTDDLFGAGSGGSAQGGSGASTGGLSGAGGLGGVSGIGGNGTGGASGIGGASDGGGADGGASGSGGETDAAPDAPTSDGSDPDGAAGSMGVGGSSSVSASVDCGGSACEISQGSVCCRSAGGGFGGGPFGGFGGSGFGGSGGGGASTTCSASGGCNNNSTRIFCDGPEDCTAGSACCASYVNVGLSAFYTELVCRPAGECMGAGRRIVCAPGAADPCPNGGNCQQTSGLPSGYEVCG